MLSLARQPAPCTPNLTILMNAGKKVPGSAFVPTPAAQSPPRWPQQCPTVAAAGAATLGFKGIQTAYLPSSTVPLRNADGQQGCHQFNDTMH